MDGDDPDLGFTASLLAHALKYEGLSDKQARYADRIVDRLTALYRRGHLASQIDSAGDGQPEGLADAQIAGHA
ncbi:hypothetical protein [Sphingomonas sanxanigenens]|uniref:Uncharacterized protein n=1 Tax=Sphingomonas sanxanigenens DSM 19645 = NX02 TaxID=1123269 RepID=W0ADB2_9SPHN|nr:hypothetical protein [Sphingomonas sanxanigenens]AHE55894.1 hypothetical protein NX02_21290 [Sphingomonas sanxanigenens DSM 19645 = NX02]